MSDNELDAELLALAGDGPESDHDDVQSEIKPAASPSPLPPPPSATVIAPKLSESPAPARPQKGVAQRRTAKSARSTNIRSQARSIEDDEESSQAASPDSLGSGAMSESDYDPAHVEKSTPPTDAVLFPIEGKFHSEKDRAEIMAMSEIKREEILAERAQELERRTQDLQLRRLYQARERDEAKAAAKNKRKSTLADLEDSPPKTSKKSKTSDSLEAYKRTREQRGEQRRREDDRKNRGRSPLTVGNGYSDADADADGESDVEWDDKPAKAVSRDEPPAQLVHFQRARIGRTNFANVCFWPGFEDAIKGCFCRVNIGVERATGQSIYRMTQIKRFTTGRPYAMEGLNGRTFMTDQYAIVAHGKSEKEWPFLAVSDSNFTDAEFERYRNIMNVEKLKFPTLSFLSGKVNDINALLAHRLTDEEIQAKLKRSGLLQGKYAPIERHRIANERKQAVLQGDEATIARLDQELAALDGPKLAFGTNLSGNANKGQVAKPPSQQERLAALNRANRKANAEEVRKAQIAERRADAKAQAAVARGEASANPFARVKTRAKVHHNANDRKLTVPDPLFDGSDGSRANTPAPGIATPNTAQASRAGTPQPGGHEKKIGGLSGLRKKNMDDDVIGAMDLGIEIDIV